MMKCSTSLWFVDMSSSPTTFHLDDRKPPKIVDTNDRFLRKITVGQGNTEKGHSRQVRVCDVTPPTSCKMSGI
ncbi:monofunctional C1-tetrahydrofolate synthase, mitochondrial isoform X1 [Tachysurus ichikawai]